jgi:hypothetical protein
MKYNTIVIAVLLGAVASINVQKSAGEVAADAN